MIRLTADTKPFSEALRRASADVTRLRRLASVSTTGKVPAATDQSMTRRVETVRQSQR